MFINYKVWRVIPLAARGTRRNIPLLQATTLEPYTKASQPLVCRASVEIHILGLVQNLQPKWKVVISNIANIPVPACAGHVGSCRASSLQKQPHRICCFLWPFLVFFHCWGKNIYPCLRPSKSSCYWSSQQKACMGGWKQSQNQQQMPTSTLQAREQFKVQFSWERERLNSSYKM